MGNQASRLWIRYHLQTRQRKCRGRRPQSHRPTTTSCTLNDGSILAGCTKNLLHLPHGKNYLTKDPSATRQGHQILIQGRITLPQPKPLHPWRRTHKAIAPPWVSLNALRGSFSHSSYHKMHHIYFCLAQAQVKCYTVHPAVLHLSTNKVPNV